MDLESTEKASDFLTYLQQLEYACADGKSHDPSKLADIHRNLYLHLIRSSRLVGDRTSSRYSNMQSRWMAEADIYLDKYVQIVDKMGDSGLNNFAEGSLAICNYHKNESTKWKTSLSVDKILQMCLQNSDDKENLTEMHEDCLISLQTANAFSVTSAVDQGSYPGSIQESKTTAFIETNQRLGCPKQQNSGVSPDCSAEFQVKKDRRTLNSISSAAKETSFQNINSGWHQPVVPHASGCTYINQPVPTYSTDASVGIQTVSGHLRNVTGNHPVHIFQDHPQGHGRNEQMTSDDLLINTSKIGGPYANFGQKPKSSLWASKKERRSGAKQWVTEDDDDDENSHIKSLPFRTAKEQLVINQQKKYGGSGMYDRFQVLGASYGAGKKSLGTRRGPASKFVPPVLNKDSDEVESSGGYRPNPRQRQDDASTVDEPVDERLRGIEPKMIELINNEIMDHGKPVLWSDIAGLEFAKKTIKEIVVWPMLRPDIFVGLRGPPKGLLLFGPPGTGKTLIGKCVASQSKSTFFCISASSLTSKWVGEGEKMVRALFAVARCYQPAVVFIDEIDSLLSQRSDAEHESSRRIKTEFLVQLDGASTNSDDRILVIGATNRPQEIDEAARRRFVKRLFIPLPEAVARRQIITNLMSHQNSSLTEEDIQVICDRTEGYSGADMTNLCREAALGPIRSIPFEMMETITPDQVRPILLRDFDEALLQVRASVSSKDLQLYTDWNQTYGSFGH